MLIELPWPTESAMAEPFVSIEGKRGQILEAILVSVYVWIKLFQILSWRLSSYLVS